MSRSELAISTGLSRSALTEMSRVLIQHQFVEESPSVIDKQRKGRPSIMLSLNARYGYFVGVGLTEDPPLMALTDCHGNVLAEHEIGMAMDPEKVAKAIAHGIPGLTRASNISMTPVKEFASRRRTTIMDLFLARARRWNRSQERSWKIIE